MPSLGCHVPDDSPLYAKAQARARERHDGKVSAYVRHVIERDLAGEAEIPPIHDPRFLQLLVGSLLPAKESRFARQWLAAVAKVPYEQEGDVSSQTEIAEALLEAFLEAFAAGQVDLVTPPAFAILGGRSWDSLLDAAHRGDLDSIRRQLRVSDPSGGAAMYQFPPPLAEMRVAEPSSTASAEQAAVEAERSRRATTRKTPRPGR